jgi:DNA-binding IclR family transcriptional regulator
MEALVTLGINRIKLAVLLALTDEGGTATTAQISQAVPSIRTTLLHHLKELVAEGYVTADLPMDEWTRGVRVAWTLNSDRLHADLRELIQRTSQTRKVANGDDV